MDQRYGRQGSGKFQSSIEKGKNNFKNEDRLTDIWDNISTILIIRI